MRTKALVVNSPGGEFVYRDVQVNDDIRDTEVLVQIVATGICLTDITFSQHDIDGMFPAILGHEGAGIISKVGLKVTNVEVGDYVILSYTSCGECKYCMRKQTSFCGDWELDNFGIGRGEDGSKAYEIPSEEEGGGTEITSHFFGQSCFSNFSVANARCCVRVGGPGSDLDLSSLAPLGCGIMAGAGAMLNVLKPSSEDIVCVVGAGAVGLAAIMALNLLERKPRQIIAVDMLDERLKLAKHYGATHVIKPTKERGLQSTLKRITNFEGIDASIDTTGKPEVVADLLEATSKLGTVCSVGVGELDAAVSINMFSAVNTGRKYVGCCMGNSYPPEFLPRLIQGWKDGMFPFTDLITRYDAEDMEKAKADVLSGKAVKAVLVWGASNE
ncbi:uncharacterized protein EAF01_010834 [Botrytis porri]|uniref:Enoyl reductase (ER) domain-containing protein n=1 Tax=Botrytis porri TaxID=87229 RepID=A0A4Z1KSP3_9HELO|nr:uncharacterized protein EAF01_010834 [Botrytis porri]KAF7889341.1 hypothetical protein EAF01_010834 [Botrytis porri]TGO86179.1 hypothetical protein BPOR_0326g00020 [Botrytis porri]